MIDATFTPVWYKSNLDECATGTGCGDAYTNRKFRVGAGGDIVEFLGTPGTHRTSTAYGDWGLMIAPYYFDDTSNNGGVYILAMCKLTGAKLNPGKFGSPGVDPADCKYDAFKVFKGGGTPPLDAIISIEPDATNGIGEEHVFTITAAALGGTPNPDPNASPDYDFTFHDITVSPTPTNMSHTCDTPTVENGNTLSCTLTINSDAVGVFEANASVTVKDSGTPQQTANATTNGENGSSGPATKIYVDASLSWEKVDDSNPAKHLAGAVFKIERITDRLDPSKTLSPSSPITTNITDCVADSDADCSGPDKDSKAGYFRVENLPFGTWKITETRAPAGYNLASPASQNATITDLDHPTGSVEFAFVNPGKYSGETATGGGYPWNVTKNSPENWFMYSPWASKEFGKLAKLPGANIGLSAGNVPLIAGQQYRAGTIKGEKVSETQRKITITLENGFRFASGAGSVKVLPMKTCTPAKDITYVQPGQFSIKTAGSNSVTPRSAEVLVPIADCYGIHVDVERPLFPI